MSEWCEALAQQHPAVPGDLVAMLAPEPTPALGEDGTVQAAFPTDLLARLLNQTGDVQARKMHIRRFPNSFTRMSRRRLHEDSF
jgi:hypothetical protein